MSLQTTISNLTKMGELSKQVENTVGKGEIDCYNQFLLFPQCFQKACFQEASKGVIVWEWVKVYSKLTKCVCETLMPPKHPSLEKHNPDI